MNTNKLLKTYDLVASSESIEIKVPSNSSSIFTLNPYFITGLTEAEGSFSIKHKDKKAKYNINLSLRFKITMLAYETELLTMVKSYFGCASLSIAKDGTVNCEIKDIKSINKYLLPHFWDYPLRGTKYLYFLSFKEAMYLINSKEHLTKEGLDKVIEISYNMNSYRKFLVEYSPNHTIKGSPEYIPIYGDYINGFIAGDGCLALNLKDVNFGRMSLQISQHKHNKLLLFSIAEYFNSTYKIYYHDINSLQLTLSVIKL